MGGGVLKIVLCHRNQNRSYWQISIVSLTCKFNNCFRFFFGISIFTTRRDPKNFKQYMLIQHLMHCSVTQTCNIHMPGFFCARDAYDI